MEDKQTESISGSDFGKGNLVYAIITARGGSKRLPRKNIKILKGKPLIAYSIIAARACPMIKKCYVTTEDQEIAEISKAWGADVINRPYSLADDNTSSEDVIHHALEFLKKEGALPRYFALLQPTSPLRTAAHLQSCIKLFMNSKARSAISVTTDFINPQRVFIKEASGCVGTLDSVYCLKSEHCTIYRPNGAIYFAPANDFIEHGTFYLKPVLPYVMKKEDSVDIDTNIDFELASLMLSKTRAKRG